MLVFRDEDLDPQRSKPEFANAMLDDLRWLGIRWQEGPDIGGPFAPYRQSERREFYLGAWRKLRDSGAIYPCTCSRKDLALAATAPNDTDDEPLYNGRCRSKICEAANYAAPVGVNWRFRVPDGETIRFLDQHQGPQSYIVGQDFGDFVIWRRDDVPAYQLAVVVDDAAMQITEIVRGADLLKSTARQLLVIRRARIAVSCLLPLRSGSQRDRHPPGETPRCSQPADAARIGPDTVSSAVAVPWLPTVKHIALRPLSAYCFADTGGQL